MKAENESMTEPLHYQTITELSQSIERREISPVEVTTAQLERIEKIDGKLKSYATVMADQAMAAAREAEAEIAAGRYRGTLHGVPVAVKDLCSTTGVATMGGTAVLENNIPDFDATVISRLRAAGAVLLGKLNLTEGAMAGYNPKRRVPQNPWREDYWPGASSSGSGAATAAGLAYATLGTDTGGSIRHPAAVCGTVGLKPTWGRVSRYGVLDLAQSLDHVGPLTRSAADAGIVMQAISGIDPKDPTTLVEPVPDMLGGAEAGARGLVIGWDSAYGSEDLAPDHAATVAAGVEVMRVLGAHVVEVTLPSRLRQYLAAWPVLCSAEAADAHRAFFPARADEYGPWFREWLNRGAGFSAADYAAAQALRHACNGEMAVTMQGIDLLVCPSTARAAYPYTAEHAYGPIPKNRDPWDSRFTVPMDFAGLPTISLPCGLNKEGLPLSLQFAGHRLAEPLLVRAGMAYESATQWHRLHPPGW
jgi:amidase